MTKTHDNIMSNINMYVINNNNDHVDDNDDYINEPLIII